jgi:hypothetical protein
MSKTAQPSRTPPNRLLKNVTSEGKTRKNKAQKRSLHGVNEHFKPNFHTVWLSAVVFQQPAKVAAIILLLMLQIRMVMLLAS